MKIAGCTLFFTKIFLLKITICLFSVVLLSNLCAQEQNQHRRYDRLTCSSRADSLRKKYKQYPLNPAYELAALVALSSYDELEQCKIKFRDTPLKTTASARPTVWSSLFKNPNKRTYIIRVNKHIGDSIIHISDVPFNAQIGLMAHELAHIKDFDQLNVFQLIRRLFSYSSKRKKEAYEKEIDRATIIKGFGWQLYDWSRFVLNQSCATKKYKSFKKGIYLQPEEIKNIIDYH